MSELGQGLSLSGLGILITFSALGILIGLILLLKALFPAQDGKSRTDQIRDESPPSIEGREELRRQAVGVGVGVLMTKMSRVRGGTLGKLLEEPAAEWWKKGVDRVHGKE